MLINKRDLRDGNLEQAGSKLGDPVEGGFGRGVQDRLPPKGLKAFAFIGRQRGSHLVLWQ